MRQSRWSVLIVLVSAAVLAGILMGCPRPDTKSGVTLLLAGDAGLQPAKTKLELDSIASLKVTVTEVAVDFCSAGEGEGEGEGEVGEGEGEGEVGEGEGEGELVVKDAEDGDCPDRQVIFTGEKEVDLRDLTGISEILSSSDLPAGTYSKIRLAIKDPKLALASDPETVLTNVQLTANGHLFVGGTFELAAGEESLVLLDFESFHLVQAGNSGKYVLTPQLRATIQVQAAAAQATGTIATVDPATSTMTVDVADSDTALQVNFASAAIWLPTDVDAPTGTAASLTVGASVQISGLLSASGVLTADTVTLIAPEG